MKYLKIAVLLLAFIPLGRIFAQETTEDAIQEANRKTFKATENPADTPYLP